jgi:hypothetical protein
MTSHGDLLSHTYIILYVCFLLFLSDSNKSRNELTNFSANPQYEIFIEILYIGVALFRVNWRSDRRRRPFLTQLLRELYLGSNQFITELEV